jgi:hypothetical protein
MKNIRRKKKKVISLLKKLNDKEQGWMVDVSLYLAVEWIDAVEYVNDVDVAVATSIILQKIKS